ncbi:hypothetical protein L1987_36701 [Smallanthus sonchifolius]|uniref:Uncharacterized protein n=1 Tax=Smallanthus sonchifolius TaxID=185202 RepID=A0ACB9HEZ7_9ASTR|nr:hypothetical protein L1987_36701 [Smallanthus sonchifolius]
MDSKYAHAPNYKAAALLFLIAFTATAAAAGGSHGGGTLGASYIFGDSLVDAGNNNFLPTLSKANIKPNGIDFKPRGVRATTLRGAVFGSEYHRRSYIVRRQLRLLRWRDYERPPGAYFFPKSTFESSELPVNRLSMDIQIDYFNITRKQINKLLDASKAREHSPDAFVDDLISHLRSQLTRLYQLDARKFIVGNVGPIGCIPYQWTINQLKENECVVLPNELALRCNAKLKDLAAELNDNLPGATFVHANVYDLVMELITNYDKYGFKTASKACCGNGGQYAGIIPCGPKSTLCEERDKYVFWDPYHPSEAANVLIA